MASSGDPVEAVTVFQKISSLALIIPIELAGILLRILC
jgi:hypothetical protein